MPIRDIVWTGTKFDTIDADTVDGQDFSGIDFSSHTHSQLEYTDAANFRTKKGLSIAGSSYNGNLYEFPEASGTIIRTQHDNEAFELYACGAYGNPVIKARTSFTGEGWSQWCSIYHEGNKPSPAAIGALPISGGSLTGKLLLQNGSGTTGGFSFAGDGAYDTGVFSPSDGVLDLYANGVHSVRVQSTGLTVTAGKDITLEGVGLKTRLYDNTSNAALDLSTSKYMRWKNYGNNHIIFDASNGTAPNGTTVNNTNSQVAWSSTYPTLMGWNGASTYGIRVDSARVADSAGTATSATSAGTASIVRSDPGGGSWDNWRDRGTMVQVDTPSSNVSAYNIWRATKWGSHHLAAMDIHDASNASGGSVRLIFNNGTAFWFHSDGTLNAPKVYNAVWNDYAELFEKQDLDLEAGDILAWDETGVVKADESTKGTVVGVYSDSYGHLLGGEANKTEAENLELFAPVGLAGRVNVKVKGSIHKGDLITTSDVPGVGCKASTYVPGTVIGKALESYTQDTIGKIKVLIMNI